jgi:hypothetical protein
MLILWNGGIISCACSMFLNFEKFLCCVDQLIILLFLMLQYWHGKLEMSFCLGYTRNLHSSINYKSCIGAFLINPCNLAIHLLQNYHTYKERIFYYNGRSQREMLPDRPFKIKTNPIGYIRRRSSPEMGCSSSSNGGITFENTSHTPSKKQDHSSKSTVTAEGSFAQERAPASQEWNICTNMNMVDSQKPGNDEDLVRPNNESRELRTLHPSEVQNREMTASSSSSVELPHCVGNGLQESNTSQPSSPLPARKWPAVAAVSTPVTVSSSPAFTLYSVLTSEPIVVYKSIWHSDYKCLTSTPSA